MTELAHPGQPSRELVAGAPRTGEPSGAPLPPSPPRAFAMSASKGPRWWNRWWERLWTPPDPDMVDAGLRGEWLIAGLRVLIVVLILYPTLNLYFQSPFERGRQSILWVAVAALAEAFVVYVAVRRSWGRRWIGFFSGILDVSLVSLCLFTFLRFDDPVGATGDSVLFPLYLLAIGATSLRYDWRICALTGTVAILQYTAILSAVLWLWQVGDPSSPRYVEFDFTVQVGRLALLAMATSLAVTLVVRAREQKRQSTRDRLTDLPNRGFFDDTLHQLEAISRRSGESVGVAMIDVDHFKRFNDTYGHMAGDVALQSVARLLGQSFRNTDLIARYGGEEFAGLFPGMRRENAARRLDFIRQRIESTPIPTGTSAGKVQVTVSIGLAIWKPEEGGPTLGDTLARADERLYLAKEGGRNRVVAGDGSATGSGPATGDGRTVEDGSGPEGDPTLGAAATTATATEAATATDGRTAALTP